MDDRDPRARGEPVAGHADAPLLDPGRRATAVVSHALAHGAGRAAPARDRQGREHDRALRRVHLRVRILARILAITRAPARSVSGRAATKARGRSRGAVKARLVTARANKARRREQRRANSLRGEWLGAESNCRHADFQSAALPTELPSRKPFNLFELVMLSQSARGTRRTQNARPKTTIPLYDDGPRGLT